MTDRESDPLCGLRAFLEVQPAGPIGDIAKLTGLLANAWEELRGSDETRMRAGKLRRIEAPTWAPPILEFAIERHGQTVNGSTRATVYIWHVDVDAGHAGIVDEKRRQLYAADKRLNVKPIAESIAAAIVARRSDDRRFKVTKDGSIRLDMALIVPATYKQTTAARRKRLYDALEALLRPHGWHRKSSSPVFTRASQ